jgi:glutamate carboxypeptidase
MRRPIAGMLGAIAVAVAVAASLMHGTAAAQPSPERLKAAVAAEKPAVVETMQVVTRIESGSQDAPGLAKLGALLASRLQALGAQVEQSSSDLAAGPVVVGRFAGTGTKSVMLIAHYDTVYATGITQREPVRIEGNRLYGPGVADSKGGIALILHAIKVLRDSGYSGWNRLTVVFNPDEEIGSRGSGPLIQKLAADHDTVLSFEPTIALRDSVLTGASGTALGVLEVTGKAAHAGVEPDAGRNALVELSHQILQLTGLSMPERGVSMHWTVAQAGDKRNVIPDSASATADIRYRDPAGLEALERAARERIATRRIPDADVRFRIDVARPAFKGDAKTDALVARAQSIYREIGLELNVIDNTGGGTDAGYAQAGGRAAVLESLGMPGMGFHAKQEWVDLNKVEPRLYLATRMIVEATR